MQLESQARRPGRVLVVEDEPDIREAIEITLRREGFHTLPAGSGHEALEILGRESADVALLDLMLPDMDGIEVLKLIRRSDLAPQPRVIILTARRDDIDRILGLELGADDYVTKPFHPRELALRVRAVLQRGSDAAGAPSAARSGRLSVGPIEIDTELHEARIEGRSVVLTLTEFRLLAELVRAEGRVRSREALLSDVWGYDSEVLSRTVDTHMKRLRSKLGRAAAWLGTVRGVGYRIQDPGVDR